MESADRDLAGSKFAKSLKQFIEDPKKKARKDQLRKQEHEEKSRRREEKAEKKLAAQKEFQASKMKEVKA